MNNRIQHFLATLIFFFISFVVHSETLPENISMTDVYREAAKINIYADNLLTHFKIRQWEHLPEVKEVVTPMVVLQLNIASIEMLHDYELTLKMRPVPIVVSSPIQYYPADIKFLTDLILSRMQGIYQHLKLPLPDISKMDNKTHDEQDVYQEMISFYMKLAALNGLYELSANEAYSQLDRAGEEMKAIVLRISEDVSDTQKKRSLVASTYGVDPLGGAPVEVASPGKTTKDIFEKCLEIRKTMKPFLKKAGIKPIPIPKYDQQEHIHFSDIFIQTQVILAELSEWKQYLNVTRTTPVTEAAENKTGTDVYQEAVDILYMLDRMKSIS